jgi:hypothetical protein
MVFHPPTDGQSERTIQTLEDMSRCFVLSWHGAGRITCHFWSACGAPIIIVIRLAYRWHLTKAMYERKCRSPLCWDAMGEKAVL